MATQSTAPLEVFDADEARAALAHASVLLSSFRWKLRDAGYPFREPPEVDALVARIDRILFPELQTRVTRKRERPRILQTPAAIAAAEALNRLSAQG